MERGRPILSRVIISAPGTFCIRYVHCTPKVNVGKEGHTKNGGAYLKRAHPLLSFVIDNHRARLLLLVFTRPTLYIPTLFFGVVQQQKVPDKDNFSLGFNDALHRLGEQQRCFVLTGGVDAPCLGEKPENTTSRSCRGR